MKYQYIRSLRTPHSERLIIVDANRVDIAACDFHFLTNGEVSAVLTLLGNVVTDAEVPHLLSEIDENLLPDVSLNDRKLNFTVVRGVVIGAYEAFKDGSSE